MVVAVDVTSQAVDYEQFYPMSKQAKENLGVDELTVMGDRGYFSAEQLALAEKEGITPVVSKLERTGAPNADYSSSHFIYDEPNDVYICP